MGFQALSLEAPTHVEHKFFAFSLPLSMLKVGGWMQKYLPQPLLKLMSLELESFKRVRGKFFFLVQTPENPKKLMKFKTLQKFKTNKHYKKNLKGKRMKLGDIPQVVFLCPPPPTKTRTQEHICKNLKQLISVSNTPFSKNKAWKWDFKHNSIFSSLKKHFFIHTCCKVEWT